MNLHSVLNVLNVLHGELTLLGLYLADDPDLLRPALEHCEQMQKDLIDPDASLHHATTLPDTIASIEHCIAQVLDSRPESNNNAEVQDSLGNLQSVFKVFEVRARELLARTQMPDQWVEVPVESLRADQHEIFAAIEKNSHGRYRILYNLAQQEQSDYYVNLSIESEDRQVVVMPLIFKDVMRDLLANARKYTPPGGTISAGLYVTAETLKFTVQDTGRGIPPDELDTVVHYGQRGSNVSEVRTMGGGFGLTKAFLVTKQFGGRFWIRSEVGVGTRIRIELPRPPAVKQA